MIKCLVSDHLGTPRMIIDQTGTLANVKRHDYLPFGEEIFAGIGGRSDTLGYESGDDVRQRFTGKEREVKPDSITSLFVTTHRRTWFTSVDVILITEQRLEDPQRINLYTYSRNNPLT